MQSNKIDKINTNKNQCINVELEYILKKDNVNWKTIDDWIEVSSQKNKNIKLQYFTKIPNELIKDYAKVLEEIENAMPTEIEEPYYKVSVENLRKEEKELEIANEEILSCVALDDHGNIIGINRVFIINADLTSIRQWQIGVTKSYQGKGIAKWLKANMYKKLFSDYPNLESIGSDTHPSNSGMIKIMERMGFKYLHITREYEDGRKVKKLATNH
ncbi:MAG: GNAT family N-acetyltransferase [Candidatus Delongbacteria bacterium]|nr:GNAT family N-acetyltransferase [Candidatus Delongbacteria bacterium]